MKTVTQPTKAAPILVRVLLIPAASLLFSCSYLTEFVVTNRSSAPLALTWQFSVSQGVSCPFSGGGARPWAGKIVPSRLWGPRFDRTSPIPALQVNEQTCQATTTVAPGATVSLHQETNFSEHNDVDRELIDRMTIQLNGGSQQRMIATGSAFESFVRRSDTLYVLEHR